MRYHMHHDGKKFVFEGDGVRVYDANVHALMQKIKRLKIGVEECHAKTTKTRKSSSGS